MRWLKNAVAALVWLALVLGLAVLASVVVVPKATGWVPLTVLSGSMSPTYPVGSQVVVERVEGTEAANALEVGDVITFMPRPDDESLTTHRIVAKSWRQDGVAVFTTRGDANGSDDAWQLTGEQIRGRVRYHVPYAGYLASTLTAQSKSTGILALALGLFAYAVWQLGQALRRRGQPLLRSSGASGDKPQSRHRSPRAPGRRA